MQNLKVAAIQANLVWENKKENLLRFDEKLTDLQGQDVDLIVLPEMFPTGFTMNAVDLAETMDGPTISWMKSSAAKLSCAIMGSLIVKENSVFFNRMIFCSKSGEIAQYDKRHLFAMAKEHEVYVSGNENIIIELNGWRIAPFICYDLRFPVWMRNTQNYDLAVVMANWPEKRIYHWDSLLISRAIENQSYIIGVNRVGLDGNNYNYPGHSCIINAAGTVLNKIEGKEIVFTETLDLLFLQKTRQQLPFLGDKDDFYVNF